MKNVARIQRESEVLSRRQEIDFFRYGYCVSDFSHCAPHIVVLLESTAMDCGIFQKFQFSATSRFVGTERNQNHSPESCPDIRLEYLLPIILLYYLFVSRDLSY